MIVMNMKDNVTLDLDDYDANFRYKYRDNMIAQFEQGLYIKSFSHQDQDKRDDGLRKIFKFWLNCVVNQGEIIPENVYDYGYSDNGIVYFFRGSKNDPELRELEKFLRINDSENNQNSYKGN